MSFSARDYSYAVAWSDEDEAYVVRVLDFPGLTAHGATDAEALAEARSVVEASLALLREEGQEIPVPASKQSYSGKVPLRMSSALHGKVAAAATKLQMSVNRFIVEQLEQATR